MDDADRLTSRLVRVACPACGGGVPAARVDLPARRVSLAVLRGQLDERPPNLQHRVGAG